MSTENQSTSEDAPDLSTESVNSPISTAIDNLIETEHNLVPIELPQEGSSSILSSMDIDEHYTPKGVLAAREIDIITRNVASKRFKKQVKMGCDEKLIGPSPLVRTLYFNLKNALPLIRKNLKNINKYLFLDETGMPQKESIDTGNDQSNRILHLVRGEVNGIKAELKQDMVELKQDMVAMEERLNTKISEQGTKINIIAGHVENHNARFENKFRGDGATHRNPYLPITNKDGKKLADDGLDEITHFSQIEHCPDSLLKKYLKFYGLNLSGTESAKKDRLGTYIGINYEFEKVHKNL